MIVMVTRYNYVSAQSHMVGYLGCFHHFTFVSRSGERPHDKSGHPIWRGTNAPQLSFLPLSLFSAHT